jgi:hypothetical protein
LGIVAVAVATVDCWRGCGDPRIVAVVDATDECNGTIVIGGVGVVAVAREVIAVQAWARPHLLFTLQFEQSITDVVVFHELTFFIKAASENGDMLFYLFTIHQIWVFAFEAAWRRNDLHWPSWSPFLFLDWFLLSLSLSDLSAMNLLAIFLLSFTIAAISALPNLFGKEQCLHFNCQMSLSESSSRLGFIRLMLLLLFIHNQVRLFIDKNIWFLSNSFDRLIKFARFDSSKYSSNRLLVRGMFRKCKS